MQGKNNLSTGFLVMGLFMVYGFFLIYLRDFAPDKEAWVNSYSIGKHFESRLAHVHGIFFAFLNIVIGFLLVQFKSSLSNIKTISWLVIGGIVNACRYFGRNLFRSSSGICIGWWHFNDSFSNLAWSLFLQNESDKLRLK